MFPTTQWSLMAIASMNGDHAGQEALEELCRRYRAPVLAFFRSQVPAEDAEDAEDLTQIVFAYLVKHGLWRRADAEKGRFRSFLLIIARYALSNWRRAARTVARGNGVPLQSLDQLMEQEQEPPAPDQACLPFDYVWACAAVNAALQRLESDAAVTPGEAARFPVLRRFLPGSSAPPTYEEAAVELGTPMNSIRTYVHRLRSDFRQALRSEIAQTLGSSEDLDGEMAHLGRVLAGGEPGAAEKVGEF